MLTYTSTWVRLENFSSHSGRLRQPCMCESSLFAVVMNAVWISIIRICMPRDDGTRTILRKLDRKKWDKVQGGHRCDLLCARIHANRRWQLTTCHWRRTHDSNSNTKGSCYHASDLLLCRIRHRQYISLRNLSTFLLSSWLINPSAFEEAKR